MKTENEEKCAALCNKKKKRKIRNFLPAWSIKMRTERDPTADWDERELRRFSSWSYFVGKLGKLLRTSWVVRKWKEKPMKSSSPRLWRKVCRLLVRECKQTHVAFDDYPLLLWLHTDTLLAIARESAQLWEKESFSTIYRITTISFTVEKYLDWHSSD